MDEKPRNCDIVIYLSGIFSRATKIKYLNGHSRPGCKEISNLLCPGFFICNNSKEVICREQLLVTLNQKLKSKEEFSKLSGVELLVN
jgi:hypothetical protein